MTLYAICHDEGDDFRLWRDDYTYVAPLFRTKTEAFNYIKKEFPKYMIFKRRKNCENATNVTVHRKKDEGFIYRCAIVPCKVVEASTPSPN